RPYQPCRSNVPLRARALPAQPNPRGRFGRGASPPPSVLACDQDLLHPAAALARLDLEEAVLLLAEEEHLLAFAEGGDDLAGFGRLGHDLHVPDLGMEHVALVEDRAALLLPARRRFL